MAQPDIKYSSNPVIITSLSLKVYDNVFQLTSAQQSKVLNT